MLAVRLAFVVATCVTPCAAAAQPWAEAVKAGDYRTASDLLHPLGIEQHQNPDATADPAPARPLAGMYARGLGVPRDPIVACALAQAAEMAFSSVDRWPPALPSDFGDRFRLDMIRSGHVRWRLEGAPPKRGWIMLPEGESR
jgi:hypothetical protein